MRANNGTLPASLRRANISQSNGYPAWCCIKRHNQVTVSGWKVLPSVHDVSYVRQGPGTLPGPIRAETSANGSRSERHEATADVADSLLRVVVGEPAGDRA